MRVQAAIRRLALAALGGASLASAGPAALPVDRFDRADYVSAIDVAQRLGLRLAWKGAGRELALSDQQHRVELAAESREATVDGLRVYWGDPVEVRAGRFFLSRTDYERRLLPLVRPGSIGSVPRAPLVIAIDPGHGGIDHGTENRRLALMEKTQTLDVAMRLGRLLSEAGYRVVMTRASDTKIELPVRALIANQAGADLFVSIHFNALKNDAKTRGTEIYTFPPRGQRSTDSWANHENNREMEAAPVNRWDPWSVVLAKSIHREVLSALRTEDRGEKLMHLAALRNLNCPGVLVESAYLSNDAEAMRVAAPAFRQQIAEAIFAGVRSYAAVLERLHAGRESGRRGSGDSQVKSPPAIETSGRPAAASAHPTRPAPP